MGNIIKASDLTIEQIQDGIITYDPDTKDYENNVIKWQIIGKEQDGENTITVQTKTLVGDGASGYGTVIGDRRYDSSRNILNSELQTWFDNDFYNHLGTDFRSKIIPTTKSISPYQDGDIVSQECKLFNLSVAEVGGGTPSYYSPESGAFTYQYYQGINSTSSNTKRVHSGGSYSCWWLRSPRTGNSHLIWNVDSDGSVTYGYHVYNTDGGPAPACVLADEIWLEEDGEGDYLISYIEPKESYQKLYAYHEKRDGSYELKSYWTSSQTVEFDDGQTLEEYKTELSSAIDSKGDEIDYSLDDGEIYLYSNGRKIATEEMSIRVAPNIQLDDISNLSIRLYQGNVRFTWTDPSDVIFSELPLVEWDGTKVVRKIGSAPNDVNDGTLVLDSKERDAYSSTPYYDENLQSGKYYYYRFFPYDKEGNYYGRTCGEIFKSIVLIPTGIPYLTETYTYTGSNITPNFVNYDTNTMTRSGTVYAKNAGTYTTTFTLKEGYKWSDDTTQPKEVTWSIGKAEGFIQLSESNITMKNQSSYTIDIIDSSNTVTVQSFDSSVIGVDIESDEITISCDLLSDTSTTFTLSVAENSNYLSTTIVVEVIIKNKLVDTWLTKTWNGYTSIYGNYIWLDGNNVYYSQGSNQYVLNKSTNTWGTKTWNGLTNFNGFNIWSDGENIYYSYSTFQYVLDKTTSTWNTKTWNGYPQIGGQNIWTDGENIYWSYNSNQYVLDKSTSTWNAKTWNGLSNFSGVYIWSDGENIYYSGGSTNTQYVLNKATSTWTTKIWSGEQIAYGNYIWTDGESIYYSDGSAHQYVLDKSTSTWNSKTWKGWPSTTLPSSDYIWTDGENIYASYTYQYVLDK